MKPYATNWKKVKPDVQYSEELELYWYKDSIYNALSAAHNGIIGIGRILRDIIKGDKNEN